MNPKYQKNVKKYGGYSKRSNIHLIEVPQEEER